MPVQAWSVPDVRAAEQAAMARLPQGELMARAASGLARIIAARLDPRGGDRVVVLVGTGDNGGDALYAAASLARTDLVGEVVAVQSFDHAHPGGMDSARRAGIRVIDVTSPGGAEQALAALGRADLVVDGVAGIGGRAGLPDPVRRLVAAIPATAHVIAVDLPSGADPAGELDPVDTVQADETVTFGTPKPVHVLVTSRVCGGITTVDIGLDTLAMPPPSAERLLPTDIPRMWPVPTWRDDKYSRGVLGVVAGGESYPGAAVLTVLAAACAGAGMVRYVGSATPSRLVQAAVPEAVYGPPRDSQRVQAWVVGPGLDITDRSEAGRTQVQMARTALDGPLPCVVDAGGLDLLTGPRLAAETPTLLTPHAGELARLLARLDSRAGKAGHDSVGDVAAVRAQPVAHARRAAELLHATVLLKGSTTVIVPPPASGLPVRGQGDAPAWLATAGAGDVLAGLAGMLLACGHTPLDAGSLAALVHGLAAHQANPGGPVRAGQVAHAIPAVIAAALRDAGQGLDDEEW